MLSHDSKFEELASAPIKQTDIVVARQVADPETNEYSDDSLVWTSSDFLMSVKIDAVGSFLSTVTKKAEVKLIGIVEGAAEGDLFQVRTGLYDSDLEDFNYVSQGFFTVDQIEFNYEEGYTLLTMYDHMWTAQNTGYNEAPEAEDLEFPTTVETLAGYMASAIRAQLMDNFSDLPNADYEIEVDPYLTIAGTTVQTVIQEIAATTGTTARITDTTLVFSRFDVDKVD